MENKPYTVLDSIVEFGRNRWLIECPFCGSTVLAYTWSLAGSGKRCPGCGAKHTWEHGTIKREGK